MIEVRLAQSSDAAAMADILNPIIVEGGTTALTGTITGDYFLDRMTQAPARARWHVAVDKDASLVGFQWIVSADYLPPEAAEIATFVQIGQTGRGIGAALFTATKSAARDLGFAWINANIRADNESGLAYYTGLGFVDYDVQPQVKLGDGRIVDKVLKRYDL